MTTNPVARVGAREAPVCEESIVHIETVSQLRPQMGQFEGLAEVFKALADETRLKVVYALSQAELCVCDVAAILGASKATASYHLRLLHHLGLARFRRDGKLVYYRLSDPHLGHMVQELLRYQESSGDDEPAVARLVMGRGASDGGDD